MDEREDGEVGQRGERGSPSGGAGEPTYRREVGRATRQRLFRDDEAGLGRIPQIAPEFANWVFEGIFGHVYQLPGLDDRSRQLCTVTILAVLGRERQLRGHLRVALKMGIPRETVVALFAQVAAYAGAPAGIAALHVLADLLDEGVGS